MTRSNCLKSATLRLSRGIVPCLSESWNRLSLLILNRLLFFFFFFFILSFCAIRKKKTKKKKTKEKENDSVIVRMHVLVATCFVVVFDMTTLAVLSKVLQ